MLSIQGAWRLKSVSSPFSAVSGSHAAPSGVNAPQKCARVVTSTVSSGSRPLKALHSSKGGIASSAMVSGCRWYARPRKLGGAGTHQVGVAKKSGAVKNKKVAYVEEADEILEEEGEQYPHLDQPHDEKDVPSDMNQPMEEIVLPKNKMVFNYKTYRYKDIQTNDPDRITHSFTVPAAMGAQVREGEGLERIMHTKENPGEDLSKDLINSGGGTPIGLDGPVTSYANQMTAAIYDILVQEKAEDIVIIDIAGKTNWLPTMIIVTAFSARHCVALANRVATELKRSKLCRAPKIERNVGDEWVIVATGTTIVEILTAENREYMDLERLWVLKKSAQETFEFDEEEERFMYDEEDGMWDDDDPDY